MKKALHYILTCCLALLASASFAQTTITFTAGETIGTNGTNNNPDSMSLDGIKISSTNAALNTAQYRFYVGGTTTITSTVGNITSIVFTCTASGTTKYGPGCIENFSTGDYTYDGKVGTWTGSASTLTFENPSKQCRATSIVVTVGGSATETISAPVISGTKVFGTSTTVTITADEGTIYYTTDGTDPTTASTEYTAPFDLTSTTTVKAIAVKDTLTSAIASETFTQVDITGEGTEASPYTVGDALNVISAGAASEDSVYVEGIISSIKEISTNYGNATFNISADGTNSDTLYVYRCKYLGNVKFTTDTQDAIAVGDTVVVYGVLTTYDSTSEIKGCLTEIKKAGVSAPVISGDETFSTSTTVTITADDGASIYYTTDGTEPTNASTEYTAPFELTTTTTVNAIAYLNGVASAVASKTFTQSSTADKGSEADPYTVAEALAILNAGTQTTDSVCVKGIIKTVKSYSTKYKNINFSVVDAPADADTLYAYAIKNVGNTEFSAITDLMAGDTVVIYGPLSQFKGTNEIGKGYLKYLGRPASAVETPSFTGSTCFTESVSVTITAEDDATIYYTTDGTEPTNASTEYTAPIELTATTTVKAIAYKGSNKSDVATQTFVKVDHEGTAEDPLTVADVIALYEADALPSDSVCVQGLVNISASDTTNVGKYGNIGFKLTDETADNSVEAFRTHYFNDEKFTVETAQEVFDAIADTATVRGLLHVYNGAVEIAYGYLVELNGVTAGITSVTKKTAISDGIRYNLAGQRVDENYKGVVIVNGRKFVVR